jgi:hypothetical protein
MVMAVPIHERAKVTKETIDAALAGGEPKSIAETDWLEDVSDKELQKLYRSFEKRHAEVLKAVTALAGKPDLDLDAVNAFAPEAFVAAGWSRGDRVLVLAAVHHDQETPVALQIWSLTREEITELSE